MSKLYKHKSTKTHKRKKMGRKGKQKKTWTEEKQTIKVTMFNLIKIKQGYIYAHKLETLLTSQSILLVFKCLTKDTRSNILIDSRYLYNLIFRSVNYSTWIKFNTISKNKDRLTTPIGNCSDCRSFINFNIRNPTIVVTLYIDKFRWALFRRAQYVKH